MPPNKPRRILALTRYSRLGPSSRCRFYQFQACLAEQGVDLTIEPFLGDWYMECLNAKRRPSLLKLIASYLRRVRALLRARKYDLLWIEREALPFIPWRIERALLPPRPIVLDFDDEPFLRYQSHQSLLVRWLLGKKMPAIIRHAAGVICGNEYLIEGAKRSGAKQTLLLPTVVDGARYALEQTQFVGTSPTTGTPPPLTIGWIGTRGNIRYLELVLGPLTALAAEGPVIIRLIGAPSGTLMELGAETTPWSETAEIDLLKQIDVGIMPLPDKPFERGKCGLKLIQYMASGKPTIASPTGANTAITRDGETGFLAATETEWLQALRRLRDDPELRGRFGAAGRKVVADHYTIETAKMPLAGFLRGVARIDH